MGSHQSIIRRCANREVGICYVKHVSWIPEVISPEVVHAGRVEIVINMTCGENPTASQINARRAVGIGQAVRFQNVVPRGTIGGSGVWQIAGIRSGYDYGPCVAVRKKKQ
jgi:hypothetical protein